jgi:hypothetical protein
VRLVKEDRAARDRVELPQRRWIASRKDLEEAYGRCKHDRRPPEHCELAVAQIIKVGAIVVFNDYLVCAFARQHQRLAQSIRRLPENIRVRGNNNEPTKAVVARLANEIGTYGRGLAHPNRPFASDHWLGDGRIQARVKE